MRPCGSRAAAGVGDARIREATARLGDHVGAPFTVRSPWTTRWATFVLNVDDPQDGPSAAYPRGGSGSSLRRCVLASSFFREGYRGRERRSRFPSADQAKPRRPPSRLSDS